MRERSDRRSEKELAAAMDFDADKWREIIDSSPLQGPESTPAVNRY